MRRGVCVCFSPFLPSIGEGRSFKKCACVVVFFLSAAVAVPALGEGRGKDQGRFGWLSFQRGLAGPAAQWPLQTLAKQHGHGAAGGDGSRG